MKKVFFFSSIIISILCSCSKTLLSDYQTFGYPLVVIKGYMVRNGKEEKWEPSATRMFN